MMASVTWILTLICVAGCYLSSASPVLRSALVVQAGQNVSLSCNLTSSVEITWGDMERGPISLEILEVEEVDAGLYFCTSQVAGAVFVNRGIRLVVNGVDGESARQPCWSLGICILPALLVLCLVFIVGFSLFSGKSDVCCCNPERRNTGQRVTEEVALHYSSLKHAHKPRPYSRGGTGLVEKDVTYSAVASRKNPHGSHDHR
ncbi:uncharacterized protein LOC125904832 isoform X2 [Epinephelus fuscoguttatus]|uniref:uncharacterized protein LOC125904832 isoform X2 n=1 Tax=Epinephelus fuscoguttatus TaxID=293821 RepID=UPI0020D04F65|nr:uncharacterized protein LOC125904832 isoform X2 [Epinephelus fuscoguttatus]